MAVVPIGRPGPAARAAAAGAGRREDAPRALRQPLVTRRAPGRQ